MIEPVSRSFAVMEALSRRPHGTIAALAAETGLPRPTVVRLLQTLVELGYATRVSRDIGYRLTDKVLGLAQGIRFVDHLVDAAAPHMSEFTRKYGWPLYLGTISNRAMTIRHSTAAESPMSFERAALQRRSPVLSSALGRAWLAFCSADERRAVLRDIGVRQDANLVAAFERIRRDGHAFTILPRSGRLQGIGVAIRIGERVMGLWKGAQCARRSDCRRCGPPGTIDPKGERNGGLPRKRQAVLKHPATMLTEAQRHAFFDHGFVALPDYVPAHWLAELCVAMAELLERSRSKTETDSIYVLEEGHSADSPRLHRVASPQDQHPTFWKFMTDPVMTDPAADVVGPDVKFHHAKLNVKSGKGSRGFSWHQDIPAWPHIDFSPVTFGIYIDGCTDDQGPLTVAEDSHEGPLFSMYDDTGNYVVKIRDRDLGWLTEDKVRRVTGGPARPCG